jgi:AraC family transcriptional regulator
MTNHAKFLYAQGDGLPPPSIAEGSAPGESGISILNARFRDAARVKAVDERHLVVLHLSEPAWVECRMEGGRILHQARFGTMGICPSGVECVAECSEEIETLLVAIDPAALAVAGSEKSQHSVDVIQRLAGHDIELFHIGQMLTRECRAGYPNGPLYWHELAGKFIDRVLAEHSTCRPDGIGATLNRTTLTKLRDYIHSRLDEPIEVADLARIAGHSPFHFTRVFARSIGFTPHRYVVHMRLKRAIELIREGKQGLAEIAVRTGFSDQSHLSRWVKRVYGVSMRQVSSNRRPHLSVTPGSSWGPPM